MYQIKNFGLADYEQIWSGMQEFTDKRTSDTADEFWVGEHYPVFTLGLAGKEEHIIQETGNIPILRTDRGGQVTYHGPGQVIIYILVDLKRINISIRELVTRIENGVINFLASLNIKAISNPDAPGVYVADKKIASLGLKVRKGCTYHGLSFNFDMDLTPFNFINVCGYKGLQVTKLSELCVIENHTVAIENLIKYVTTSIYAIITD